MRRTMPIGRVVALVAILTGAVLIASASTAQVKAAAGRTYYVRQTVGDDGNDGQSPRTAWRHISKLSRFMEAGDTAYIGPGLYRDAILVKNTGTAENRITFIADSTGERTGDPAGVVMITGAEPLTENIFVPDSARGVYRASFAAFTVVGVVEMDGDQRRYNKAEQTKEYLADKMPPVDIVTKYRSTYHYDKSAKVLYIHTSDDRPPDTHEIELIRRLNGFFMNQRRFVTVIGFTFRHMGDSGIDFWASSDGVAMNNTAYGSRIGIRALYAPNTVAYGNTLFRNENSGVYFLRESVHSVAAGNILYENIKGVRVGSKSEDTLVMDNTAFENEDGGISIEYVSRAVVIGNRMVNNRRTQLLVLEAEYRADGNCFEKGSPTQLTAEFYPYLPSLQYRTLAEYQQGRRRDLSSRQGGCAPLPEKIDVHRLHAESRSYAERARKVLGEPAPEPR